MKKITNEMKEMWELEIHWCDCHHFRWIIVNNHFYWQTNYQTGEITTDNETIWHPQNYFNDIIRGMKNYI